MVLRSYEDLPDEWRENGESCLNCGAPVYEYKVLGVHPDGIANFGTARKCFACEHPHPSAKSLAGE